VTPLPPALGGPPTLVGWRLDDARHAATWDSGEGAFRFGGRWNRRGSRAVYCAIDPSTAILEVAVHKGFAALDAVAHVLTSLEVIVPARVKVLRPEDVPQVDWLRPGVPDPAQQAFGDRLLAAHGIIVLPSVVSARSWNLVLDPAAAAGAYVLRDQDRFTLDRRLRHDLRPAP